jgi:hypothetical protein
VSAPGLYRYVASREELVGHMVDLVSADVDHPPPSGNWVHDVTVVAEQQRALFRAHPWLAEAVASLRVMGPHVLDHLDWGLAALADVEAPPSRKMEAIALANGIAALFSSTSRHRRPDAAVNRPLPACPRRRTARGAGTISAADAASGVRYEVVPRIRRHRSDAVRGEAVVAST